MNNEINDQAALGYAGDISVSETWETLENNPQAVLIDVRTSAEWNFVGLPDLSALGKTVQTISWQVFPDMAVNENFVAQVASIAPAKNAPLLFLCRSGVRSKGAAIALTGAGYSACHNIIDGFEGGLDADKHRGRVGGWKAAGLPWEQK